MKEQEGSFPNGGERRSKPLKTMTNHMGNYLPIFRNNGRGVDHFLTLGPEYMVFLGCFLVVNGFSLYMLYKLSQQEEAKLYYLVYMVVVIYLDIAWIACALMNPGIALEDDNSSSETCEDCYIQYNLRISKIEGRVHCKACETCIDEYKHHCFMTGNCVGKNNFIPSYFMILGLFIWVIDLAATLPYVYYM